MTYTVHPGAERDIADAPDFYVKQAGLIVAQRFLAEFDRVVNLVDRNPEADASVTKSRRMFHLSVFPYSVVYRKREGGIQVLVVRHHHRKPTFGMRRS